MITTALSRSSILFPYYPYCCISPLLLRYTTTFLLVITIFLFYFLYLRQTPPLCRRVIDAPVNGFPVMPAGVSIAPE